MQFCTGLENGFTQRLLHLPKSRPTMGEESRMFLLGAPRKSVAFMTHLERTYSSQQLLTTTINFTSACVSVDSWKFLTFLSLTWFTSLASTRNLQAHWPRRQVCYLYFRFFALNPISQSHPSNIADHLYWSLFSAPILRRLHIFWWYN